LHANKGLSLKGLEMPWEAPQHCMEEETCVNVMMETTRTDKGWLDARTDRKAIDTFWCKSGPRKCSLILASLIREYRDEIIQVCKHEVLQQVGEVIECRKLP